MNYYIFPCFLLLSSLDFAVSSIDVVAVCGSGVAELLDGSAGFPAVPSRRDHVAVLPEQSDSMRVVIFENETSLFHPVRCALRIETCPSCIVNIKYAPPSQYMDDKEIRMMSSCFESVLDPCLDLKFVEEKADTALDLVYWKSSVWDEPGRTEINSTGDSILLVVTLWNIEPNTSLNAYIENLFPITVTSLSNTEVVTGVPSESILMANQSSIGFIQSPRYPSAYPRSVSKEYSLINTNPNGFVRLVFDDFHVHFQSELQIVDSDSTVLFNTRNEHRRPPAFVSRGPNITLHFHAHDFTQMVGFRARFEFVDDHDWSEKPNPRNCDEALEGYGGEVQLDGAAHLTHTYVDCIWVIGRFPHMSRTFDRIYLKVESFQLKGVGLRLEVREGASSTAERLLLLFDAQTRDQLDHKQPRHGFATSLATPAYYVRLRGFLISTSGFEMVYSQFYRWATALCPGVGEFHCDNARCIKATLRCDSINHCGDGSDEQCHRPVNELKPPDADVSGLIALVVGVCGLIVLLLSTTAIMAKMYRRKLARQLAASRRRDATSPAGYPAESVPSIQTVGDRRFYVLPESQISVIEAPPTYDDAMKQPATRCSQIAGSYRNQAYSGSIEASSPERSLSPNEPPPTIDDPSEFSDIPESSMPSTSMSNTSLAGSADQNDVISSSSSSSSSSRCPSPQLPPATVSQESARDPESLRIHQYGVDEESWV